MRKLALWSYFTKSLAPLERMTGIEQLTVDLFRDPLDPVSKLTGLTYLEVRGPAKGWAKLGACAQVETARLFDVQIANLKRWNSWTRLRSLVLSERGRGIKSLTGLEAFQQLEALGLGVKADDLSPLRELPRLTTLTLFTVDERGLESVAAVPTLRHLVIDNDALCLSTLKPLTKAASLEELILCETKVENGDLMPLAELPNLRKVWLTEIANVDALRAARPDLTIHYHYDHYPLPDQKWEALFEQIGAVKIRKPGEGLTQWSVFQSLADVLRAPTNYDAETRIKRAVRQRDPALAKRLEWDTEGGNVAAYSDSEDDIRTLADIINDLVQKART